MYPQEKSTRAKLAGLRSCGWQQNCITRAAQSMRPSVEVGISRPLYIRHEKLSQRKDACRVLYVSDIHLRPGRSDELSRQVLASVIDSRANVVLFGGDMIDSAGELENLSELVAHICPIAPLFAIAGNHDVSVGIDLVRSAITAGGGTWIYHNIAQLEFGARRIAIAGPAADSMPQGDVRILCAHNPRIWKTSRHRGFDLVLAGHLHGCQVVAFEYRNRL